MADNFKERFSQAVKETETVVYSYLPEETGHQKTIFEAMNYSVKAGGKRLRPLLMREVYRLFGGNGPEIEPFMAAMEMIHTSSLIHDDLPAMDDDELRRGRPTNHMVYGEATAILAGNDEYRRGKLTTWKAYGYDMAVLAGDALMIYAFETASKAFSMGADPAKVGRAIGILAEKTGIYGMIGGQTVDVELTGKAVPREKLDFIYRLKTGALLEASMMIGAVLAGATVEEIKEVETMASEVGLAFQIQDDILDVTSTQEELGKPVLSDEKNEKTTYVTLEGLEKAKRDVKEISDRAAGRLAGLPGKNEFLYNIIEMLVNRRN